MASRTWASPSRAVLTLLLLALPVGRAARVDMTAQQASSGDDAELDVAADMLRKLDANSDGRIDQEEFDQIAGEAVAATSQSRPGTDAGAMGWLRILFDRADLDHDGQLDKIEATVLAFAALEGVDHIVQRHTNEEERDGVEEVDAIAEVAADVLEELDEDFDGKVDRSEMVDAVARVEQQVKPGSLVSAEEHFAAADVDGDGSLDESEVEGFVDRLGFELAEIILDAARGGSALDSEMSEDPLADAGVDMLGDFGGLVEGRAEAQEPASADLDARGHSVLGKEDGKFAELAKRQLPKLKVGGEGARDEDAAGHLVELPEI